MAAVLVLNTPDDGRLTPRNMYSDSAEIKPAQCCIKLEFHLTYTVMHGSTNLKLSALSLSLFTSDFLHICLQLEGLSVVRGNESGIVGMFKELAAT